MQVTSLEWFCLQNYCLVTQIAWASDYLQWPLLIISPSEDHFWENYGLNCHGSFQNCLLCGTCAEVSLYWSHVGCSLFISQVICNVMPISYENLYLCKLKYCIFCQTPIRLWFINSYLFNCSLFWGSNNERVEGNRKLLSFVDIINSVSMSSDTRAQFIITHVSLHVY